MSETSLLRIVNAQIEELVLDASLSEDHSFTSRVSQFPIESGATISDHIFNEPAQVTLTGIVSNSPILGEGSVIEPNRAESAFATLMNIRLRRQPVTIVTGLNVYFNMVMTSLQVPRTAYDALEFTASFTQITLVSTTRVEVQNVASSASNTTSKVKKGSVTPQVPVPPQEVKGSIYVTQTKKGYGLDPKKVRLAE